MREFGVGLAVGSGTGEELANAFQQTIRRLGRLYSVEPTVHRSQRVYHSYFSLLGAGDFDTISRLTYEDAAHYEAFCRKQAAAGVAAIFRTAINAQSLYLVREHLFSVKVEPLETDQVSVLLVRDQLQGFYTGHNVHHPRDGVVERKFRLSRELIGKVLSFAIGHARRHWGDD